MRRYQSSCCEARELLPSEYLALCRASYGGCVFTLMVEAGSALVEVVSIGDDFSVSLVRRCRRYHATDTLVIPLSSFLSGLESGCIVACA
jgi:hypothetical protein